MITIVASSKLTPTPELVAVLAGLVATAPAGEPFGIRVSGSGVITSPTEHLVSEITKAVGRNIVRWQPDNARHAFQRDYLMVEQSRLVVAFFPAGEAMTGGTGHVVKASIDRGVQVEAYEAFPNGEIMLIGSMAAGSDPGLLRALEEANSV